MPRVYLSENERMSERLASWIYGELRVQRIPQRVLAEEMEVSQPALAQKLKNRSFSFTDFLAAVRVLKPDTQEIERLLGR